jgi:hypothetical protein
MPEMAGFSKKKKGKKKKKTPHRVVVTCQTKRACFFNPSHIGVFGYRQPSGAALNSLVAQWR